MIVPVTTTSTFRDNHNENLLMNMGLELVQCVLHMKLRAGEEFNQVQHETNQKYVQQVKKYHCTKHPKYFVRRLC